MDIPTPPVVTTIGQLLYDRPPPLNFARLVADLDAALAGCAVAGRRLAWDHDDVAILDVGSSRIALGHEAGLTGGAEAVVTVMVGHGPDPGADAALALRQGALARLIAERIASRFPPREARWSESDEVATPELFDRLNEPFAVPQARPAPVPRPAVRRLRPARGLDELAEVPRLLARVDATLAARRAGRSEPRAASAPACGTATGPVDGWGDDRLAALPRSQPSGLQPVRAALYAGPEDLYEPLSPMLRLAAHALDASLMVVALPVGAAMMTYSLGRGPNLRVSAQMLAVGGICVGGLQSIGGLAGLGGLIPLGT